MQLCIPSQCSRNGRGRQRPAHRNQRRLSDLAQQVRLCCVVVVSFALRCVVLMLCSCRVLCRMMQDWTRVTILPLRCCCSSLVVLLSLSSLPKHRNTTQTDVSHVNCRFTRWSTPASVLHTTMQSIKPRSKSRWTISRMAAWTTSLAFVRFRFRCRL